MATTANGRYYAGIVDPSAGMYPQDPGMDAAAMLFSTPGLASEFMARKAMASQGRERLLEQLAANNMMRSQLATQEMANERNMKLGGDILQYGDKAGIADIPSALVALMTGGTSGLAGAMGTPAQSAVTASRVQGSMLQPTLSALDIIGKAGANFDPGQSGSVLDLLMSNKWNRNPSNVQAAGITASAESKPKFMVNNQVGPDGLLRPTITATAGNPQAAVDMYNEGTTALTGKAPGSGTTPGPRTPQTGTDVDAVKALKAIGFQPNGPPVPTTSTDGRSGWRVVGSNNLVYFYDPATRILHGPKSEKEAPKP